MNSFTSMTFVALLCVSQIAAQKKGKGPDEDAGGIIPGVFTEEQLKSGNLLEHVPITGGSSVGGFQAPTSTFTENGGFVWEDSVLQTQGTFQDYPLHYVDDTSYQLHIPRNYLAPRGTYSFFRCPRNSGSCDVIVFAYECGGCGRSLKTGSLFNTLSNKGFERSRCAPTFRTGAAGGKKHQMVAYVKTINPSDLELIALLEDTHFVAFAMSRGNRPACSTYNTKDSCEAQNYRCAFDYLKNTCVINKCSPTGPGVGCAAEHCALAEYP